MLKEIRTAVAQAKLPGSSEADLERAATSTKEISK